MPNVNPSLAPSPDDGVFADNYRDYAVNNSVDYESGLIVLPLASAKPGDHIVVRLHAPMGVRKVAWRGTKEGTPPVCPKAKDLTDASGNVTDTLLASSVDVPLPVVAQNGRGYTWRASGSMTFVQTTPTPGDGSKPIGTAQYPFQSIYANAVPNAPENAAQFAGYYGYSLTTLDGVFFGDNILLPSGQNVEAYTKPG